MKNLFLLFIILSFSSFSQTVNELEEELQLPWTSQFQKNGLQLIDALLAEDPFNDIVFSALHKHDDSLSKIKLRKILDKYPDRPEPYYLRAKYSYLNHEESLALLNKAFEKDSLSAGANYYLGEYYYNKFIYPLLKEDYNPFEGMIFLSMFFSAIDNIKYKAIESQHSPAYAEKAYKYFFASWNLNAKYRYKIYFPLKQLECYLKKNPSTQLQILSSKNGFFPYGHFATPKGDWQCNFSIDYLWEFDSAEWNAIFLKLHLQAMQELSLYNAKVNEGDEIYRFTYLPSFDQPVAVRVEKKGNEIFFNWKIGKGAGGYYPVGLDKEGRYELTQKQWKKFKTKIKKAKYTSQPNKTYVLMIDGESWALEHKTTTGYMAKYTNWAYEDFTAPFIYLMEIAGVNFKLKYTEEF